MNIRKTFIVFGLVLAFALMLPVARASEENQATKVTFSQPFQIPGSVLPAGTYWFELPDNISEHEIVHIFNSDRTVLYATLLTADAERSEPADKTTITFAEGDMTQPQAIVAWFYPGEATGHEFLYFNHERKELARDKRQTVVAGH